MMRRATAAGLTVAWACLAVPAPVLAADAEMRALPERAGRAAAPVADPAPDRDYPDAVPVPRTASPRVPDPDPEKEFAAPEPVAAPEAPVGDPSAEPPVAAAADVTPVAADADTPAPRVAGDAAAESPPTNAATDATLDETPRWGAFEILGAKVKPGRRRELHWTAGQTFDGRALETPVVVIRGRKPGPTLCLTAAVHGDELNGVEIVRRVLSTVDAKDLSGTVIGVPIVNLLGFSQGTRYLPDRRDLNRYFPGHPRGSSASRIANGFFTGVIRLCDRLVDFHTGSFKRTNLPQLRADLTVPSVRNFIERFGATAVLHKRGGRGTLRVAATNAGIPAVAFELGEPGTLQLGAVEFGVKAMDTLLDKLGMVTRFSFWSEPQPIFYHSRWLRAYRGGILTSGMRVGRRVRRGDVLGVVTNPVTNESTEILSPYDGRLLGRALNQFVLPGFATFHVGIAAAEVPAPDGSVAVDDGTPEAADDTDDADELDSPSEPVAAEDPVEEESH